MSNQVKWKKLRLNRESFNKFWGEKKNFYKNIFELSLTTLTESIKGEGLSGFTKFVAQCGNLTCLNISIPIINDDDLWIIAKYCKNLREVRVCSSFKEFSRITDQGIQVLTDNTRYLRRY